MPGARCTRGLACMGSRKCAHEHTGQRGHPTSLRNGFTAYNVISPAGRARCHRRPSEALASSELDADRGVRTTRLYRTQQRRSLSALPASTATRPTIVTIMIRPSERNGMAGM